MFGFFGNELIKLSLNQQMRHLRVWIQPFLENSATIY